MISALLALTILMTTIPAASAVDVFGVSATPSKAFKGVDVSRWNDDIDWNVMKSKGIDFAIMRCYSYGIDKKFIEYYDGASEVGIDIGAYVFMYATTQKEAVSEAKAALEALDGRAQLRHDSVLACLHLGIIEREGEGVDAVGGGIGEGGEDVGVAAERLGGDAAAVEAGASGVAALDDGDRLAVARRISGSLVAARAAADDDDVCHCCLLRLARRTVRTLRTKGTCLTSGTSFIEKLPEGQHRMFRGEDIVNA